MSFPTSYSRILPIIKFLFPKLGDNFWTIPAMNAFAGKQINSNFPFSPFISGRTCQILSRLLSKCGFSCAALHSMMNQKKRFESLHLFKSKQVSSSLNVLLPKFVDFLLLFLLFCLELSFEFLLSIFMFSLEFDRLRFWWRRTRLLAGSTFPRSISW